MDGKTKGLIVGDNFVIEEGSIVATTFSAPVPATADARFSGGMPTPAYAYVHLQGGGFVMVSGELSRRLFDRAKSILERRHQYMREWK